MAEWKTMTLRDAGVSLIDCVHKTPPAASVGYPYVAIPQMKNGRISFDGARRISHSDYVEWTKKARPQVHDVVLSRRTNPGVTATFGNQCEFALGQNLVLLRSDGRFVRPEFLRWLTISPAWWSQIEKFNNVGAVFDSLRCADVPKFELPIPPIRDQEGIASVLSALDDKIDLNRRMNETLEAMARAIFKDWFTDFGPTRAKMEGRAAYLAPEAWAHFPDQLDEEEKPIGWKRGILNNLCELKRGYDLPTAQRKPGSIPILSSSGVSGLHDIAMVNGPGVVTGRYGTIGEVFFVEQPFWPLNTALYVRDFKGNSARFVYHTLLGIDFNAYSDKGAVPGINRNHLHQARAVIPPTGVQNAFDELLSPTWMRIEQNKAENATLEALQKLLLPKLMSGEIRPKEAEKAIERAA